MRYRTPKPCPRCGGDEVEVHDEGAGCKYACRCLECGHTGEHSFAIAAAIAFWNAQAEREG